MLVISDPDASTLHWYDTEMNQLRQAAMGFEPTGLTIQNDMLVVSDFANNTLRWYDAEMNQLRQAAIGYRTHGSTLFFT